MTNDQQPLPPPTVQDLAAFALKAPPFGLTLRYFDKRNSSYIGSVTLEVANEAGLPVMLGAATEYVAEQMAAMAALRNSKPS